MYFFSPPDFLQFDVPAKPDDFILLKNETEKTIAYKVHCYYRIFIFIHGYGIN